MGYLYIIDPLFHNWYIGNNLSNLRCQKSFYLIFHSKFELKRYIWKSITSMYAIFEIEIISNGYLDPTLAYYFLYYRLSTSWSPKCGGMEQGEAAEYIFRT